MSEFAAKEFLDQATQSLQNGQPQQALEFAQNAIGLEPENADAYLYKAIAESQLNRAREAVDSFETAIKLAPESSKAYFNFAVHYFGAGEKRLALDTARKAVACDPSHAGAKDLVQRLETELGVAPLPTPPVGPSEGMPPSPEGQPRPPENPYRPGYEQPLHSVRFVESMGGAWNAIGWVLSILTILLVIIVTSVNLPVMMEYASKVLANPDAAQSIPKPDVAPIITFLSYFETALRAVMLGWIIIDLADRRGKWLWMLPYALCCCCGFQGIVNAIYLLVTRAKR